MRPERVQVSWAVLRLSLIILPRHGQMALRLQRALHRNMQPIRWCLRPHAIQRPDATRPSTQAG